MHGMDTRSKKSKCCEHILASCNYHAWPPFIFMANSTVLEGIRNFPLFCFTREETEEFEFRSYLLPTGEIDIIKNNPSLFVLRSPVKCIYIYSIHKIEALWHSNSSTNINCSRSSAVGQETQRNIRGQVYILQQKCKKATTSCWLTSQLAPYSPDNDFVKNSTCEWICLSHFVSACWMVKFGTASYNLQAAATISFTNFGLQGP